MFLLALDHLPGSTWESRSPGAPPALLALQKRAVGGDLGVQGQLDPQQCLVVPQQPSQLLFTLLQGLLHVLQLLLRILESPFSSLLCIGDGSMYLFDLFERQVEDHRGTELLDSDLGRTTGEEPT